MPPAQGDLIQRGDKRRNVLGTTTFVGARALDPFFQYAILGRGLADKLVSTLGSSTLNQGSTSNTGYAVLDNLQLSPYRLIILSMAVGSSAKHIIWKLLIGEENMGPVPAIEVGIFNTIFNTVNSLLFISTATSLVHGRGEGLNRAGQSGLPLKLGTGMFAVGITVELLAELQRMVFKREPANRGKPYTGGLFGAARHINYTGYTVWRAGYALAAGGWVWGAITGAFFAYDFSQRAVPAIDTYCKQRYADMWEDYKLKTPYKLLPFVY